MKMHLKPHPDLDFFTGIIGGSIIPTKQDRFKPVFADEVIIKKDGEKKTLEKNYDLYAKKRSKNSLKKFEKELQKQIENDLTDEHPFSKDIKVEVIISVSMEEKRFNEVDVDNLAKSILDCFSGTLLEDDSQVVNIFVTKNVNQFLPLNGLFVGVRKIKNENDSWFKNIKVAYLDENGN